MITKQDVLDRANQWQLRAEVVEKDYVLGWLLAAVALHEETSTNWVLKGGTCIKKCFVETYRFSEDLDFSLLDDAAYTDAELVEVLRDVSALAAEMSGIQFDPSQISIISRIDKLQRPTMETVSFIKKLPLDSATQSNSLSDNNPIHYISMCPTQPG